jgi:hypothetical protein
MFLQFQLCKKYQYNGALKAILANGVCQFNQYSFYKMVPFKITAAMVK